MRNILVSSWLHSTPERFTAGELINNFRKALLNKEDGAFPLYTDIEEAFQLFVSHMRAIDPLCANFIQSRLKDYNGTNFPGLQGYIRYIEKEVIAPLEKPLNTESTNIIATKIRCYQIISLGETIFQNNNSLIILDGLKREIEQLLNEAESLEEVDRLLAKQTEVQTIIDSTAECLKNARILFSKLTNKQQ